MPKKKPDFLKTIKEQIDSAWHTISESEFKRLMEELRKYLQEYEEKLS